MILKIKYANEDILPLVSREGDSGFDIRANIKEPLTIPGRGFAKINTGISVEISSDEMFVMTRQDESDYVFGKLKLDYELQVRPRSGHTSRGLVAQFGTIDASYRGEIAVILYNFNPFEVKIEPQERIAQLVISPIIKPVEVIRVETLGETERGNSGFGSTGKI
jgi:dUTP pyrophosphatase